jgi:SAM-dependent methyltransferase
MSLDSDGAAAASAALGPPTQCELCGSKSMHLLHRGNIDDRIEDRFSQYAFYDDMYRCAACGLIVEQRIRSEAEIKQLLAREVYLDEAIGQLNVAEKHHQFNQLIGLMQRHADLSQARILDIGANTGVFLSMLRRYTPNLMGIEPSEEAARFARESFALDVRAAVIADADLAADRFDMITGWDVIEHLTEPLSDLRRLHQAARSGGLLFLTTHDIGSILARLTGPAYPMYMYQHFYHFTPTTLRRAVEIAGFDFVAVHRFRKSWSLAYLAELPEKKWPGSTTSRVVRRLLAPLLAVPRLRDAQIYAPMREFFMLVARKP